MVAANKPHVETVRVVPTSDALRRVLVHPSGRKMRTSGSVEWPMDKFTARRLAEGSIKIEKKADERPARERTHERSTSHHNTAS